VNKYYLRSHNIFFMRLLLTTLSVLFISMSFAQNGPGGVGNTNGTSDLSLWLKADQINQISGTSVTSWLDASGHENNAIGGGNAPIILDDQLYGHSTVNFSSLGEQSLRINHDGSLNSDYVTVFVVGRMNSTSHSKGTYLVKTSSKSLDDGYGLIRLNSKEKVRFFAGDYGVNRDSEHFHYSIFDLVVGNFRTGSTNEKITAMINNVGSSTTVTNTNVSSNNNMYLGARPGSGGYLKSFLDGDIAEVVILSKDLPSTQRIIVSNYLAAKYGFAISNDKYAYHSTHPNDVIGIGRYDNYTHATSISGVLELAEKPGAPLTNGTFLMVGHDGASLKTITSNLPVEFSQRYQRTWRSHSNGNITKEKVKFHINPDNMPTNISDYALLLDYDGDADFSNAIVITPDNFDLATNVVEFNNIHLHTGAVFTLAFYKAITWDGTNFANGSGLLEAPDQTDGGRNFIVSGLNAIISTNASVYETTVQTGSSIVLNSSACLTINSKIHNDGHVQIAESASLIQTSEGPDMNTGNGTFTLQRTGLDSQYGYNNWSSPMKRVELDVVFPHVNYCDLLTYNEFTQNWSYDFYDGFTANCNGNTVIFSSSNSIAGGDGFMDVTRGYFITGNTINPQKTFTGQINNGSCSKTIVATEYGNNTNWNDDDWNFVGNPYPSALDPYAFWQENAIDNNRITDALHFWDDLGIQGAAYDQYNDYASWNLTGGIASDNSTKVISNLNHIASGQGFMIWASDTFGTDSIGNFRSGGFLDTVKVNTIVFNNSMRSCNNSLFYKNAESTKELNWLQLTAPSGSSSKLLLGTVKGATDYADVSYDARRTTSATGAVVEFSSLIKNDTLGYRIQGIEPLSTLHAHKTIGLKLITQEIGAHTISRAAFQLGGAPLKMYLKDNLFNVVHDFDDGDYIFHLNTATRDFSRFEIIFEYDALNNSNSGSKGGVTSIEEVDNYFTINPIENGFVIKSNEGISGEISVFDISGRQVYYEKIATPFTVKHITLSGSTGIYIVKIIDTEGNTHTDRTLVH
jgi:hypothetical protein